MSSSKRKTSKANYSLYLEQPKIASVLDKTVIGQLRSSPDLNCFNEQDHINIMLEPR